jgi:hypothetical protein
VPSFFKYFLLFVFFSKSGIQLFLNTRVLLCFSEYNEYDATLAQGFNLMLQPTAFFWPRSQNFQKRFQVLPFGTQLSKTSSARLMECATIAFSLFSPQGSSAGSSPT